MCERETMGVVQSNRFVRFVAADVSGSGSDSRAVSLRSACVETVLASINEGASLSLNTSKVLPGGAKVACDSSPSAGEYNNKFIASVSNDIVVAPQRGCQPMRPPGKISTRNTRNTRNTRKFQKFLAQEYRVSDLVFCEPSP